MSRSFVARARFVFVVAAISIAFIVLAARLYYLHIWSQDRLQRIVQRNRHKFQTFQSRRGNIVDKEGTVLATTRAVVTLGVDPQMVPEDIPDARWQELEKLTGINWKFAKEEAGKKIIRVEGADGPEIIKPRWRKLADGVDDATYEAVLDLSIKGIYGNRKFERLYPSGTLAAHVIGFLNKEDMAVTGVEYFMNFYLKGQDGWIESEKDGRRREMYHFRTREVEPRDGYHVELTLDSYVQNVIEEELGHIVEKYDPIFSTIIVSEPSTGYILGLANYPSFDPNTFWEAEMQDYRNRAVTDVFEPGSTFKIVAASGALNENVIRLTDTFDCRLTTIEYKNRKVHLPKDDHPMGVLTASEVVTKSSNRGVAHFAMRLGDRRMYEYSKAFGFGEKTGYGPSGEVSGILHDVEDWDGLTISRLPMGHALAATPMQVHYAMSVLANGGVLMKPQVIRRVFDDQGLTLFEYPPIAKHRVVSYKVAKTMAELLTTTSQKAKLNGYSVAGKTGTSQKIINGKYSHSEHVGSYSGFFPADRPAVVITIVIDSPKIKGTGYGNLVAAPSFHAIGEQLINYLNIRSDSEYNHLLMNKKT